MSVASAAVAVTTPQGTRDVPGVLRMVTPLPGLPGHDEYTLEPLDATGLIFTLRSAPEGLRPVRLFVAEPHAFFPDYDPALPATAVESLGLGDEAAVLLVVVHPADEDRHSPSANLLAPLVVEAREGRAAQVVLDEDLPLRAPLG